MSNSRKVLIAGLGKNALANTHAVAFQEVFKKYTAEMERVHQAGFATTELQLEPDNIDGSLKQVKEALEAEQFDAFAIGYGLRGMKELTVLFEGIVNCAREMRPGMKLLFTTAPDGIMEALERL